jgi:membrane protease YdiL (CAAX protease family)
MMGKPLDRVLILNITIVVEALLLLLATLWSQFGEIQLLPLFHLNRNVVGAGLLSGLAIAATGFALFWAANKFGSLIPWLGNLSNVVKEDLIPLFQTLNIFDITLVALSSGFCEEIFFRGVIQDQLGLWLAAALFGFFHCPTPRHITYGIWAFSAGLFLGWLLNVTGSLWAPIFAHALSNFLVLSYLRYGHKSDNDEIASASASKSDSNIISKSEAGISSSRQIKPAENVASATNGEDVNVPEPSPPGTPDREDKAVATEPTTQSDKSASPRS